MKKLSLCLFACCSLLLALTACNGDNPSPVNYTLSLDRFSHIRLKLVKLLCKR